MRAATALHHAGMVFDDILHQDSGFMATQASMLHAEPTHALTCTIGATIYTIPCNTKCPNTAATQQMQRLVFAVLIIPICIDFMGQSVLHAYGRWLDCSQKRINCRFNISVAMQYSQCMGNAYR